MNIKNRLNKLHSQIIGSDSEFCACPGEIRTEVLIPFFDGEKYVPMVDGEPIREPLEDYDTPEFCATCGKPNAEPLHVTISPKVELTGEKQDEHFE